ncbi:MAG: hypothetical protein AAF693_19535 [Bacteroidota bacterium]
MISNIVILKPRENQKSLGFVNMLILALGIACAIFIFLYISQELKDENLQSSDSLQVIGLNLDEIHSDITTANPHDWNLLSSVKTK